MIIFGMLLATALAFGEESPQDEQQVLVIPLEKAIARALRFNRQLQGSFEGVQRAELGLDLSLSEFEYKVVPTSQIGYAGGRRDTEFTVGGGVDIHKKFTCGARLKISPSFSKLHDKYRSNILSSLNIPLLRRYGQEYTLAGVRAGEFAQRSTQRALWLAEIGTVVRTVSASYEIIRQEEIVRLTQESYQRLKCFKDAAVLKEKIGLADSLDVFRAEIELKQAEESLNNAQERLLDAYDVLKDILALPLNRQIKVEAPLTYRPSEVEMADAIQAALDHRLEIDQAADQVQETYRLSYLAKQNLLPDLNLLLTYNNLGEDHDFFRSCRRDRIHSWGIGFTTAGDMNQDAEQIAVEQSLIAVQASERNFIQTKENVVLDVKRSLRSLSRALKKIEVQREQIKSAQGELSLSRLKFDHGFANNFDVIQAEKNLRFAENSYLNAIIEHIVGEYQLWASMGFLIPDAEGNICYALQES